MTHMNSVRSGFAIKNENGESLAYLPAPALDPALGRAGGPLLGQILGPVARLAFWFSRIFIKFVYFQILSGLVKFK